MPTPAETEAPHQSSIRLLHSLGERTENSFELEKRLRCHKTPDVELYMLYRLANVLEEPKRSLARAKLKKTLAFRDLVIPSNAKPMVTGMLCHQLFKGSLKHFLSNTLGEHPEACIPLHIPKPGVVESKWKRLQDILWNFRKFTQGLHVDKRDGVHCVCERYRFLLPDSAWSADGHVAVSGFTSKSWQDTLAIGLPGFSCVEFSVH